MQQIKKSFPLISRSNSVPQSKSVLGEPQPRSSVCHTKLLVEVSVNWCKTCFSSFLLGIGAPLKFETMLPASLVRAQPPVLKAQGGRNKRYILPVRSRKILSWPLSSLSLSFLEQKQATAYPAPEWTRGVLTGSCNKLHQQSLAEFSLSLGVCKYTVPTVGTVISLLLFTIPLTFVSPACLRGLKKWWCSPTMTRWTLRVQRQCTSEVSSD